MWDEMKILLKMVIAIPIHVNVTETKKFIFSIFVLQNKC